MFGKFETATGGSSLLPVSTSLNEQSNFDSTKILIAMHVSLTILAMVNLFKSAFDCWPSNSYTKATLWQASSDDPLPASKPWFVPSASLQSSL